MTRLRSYQWRVMAQTLHVFFSEGSRHGLVTDHISGEYWLGLDAVTSYYFSDKSQHCLRSVTVMAQPLCCQVMSSTSRMGHVPDSFHSIVCHDLASACSNNDSSPSYHLCITTSWVLHSESFYSEESRPRLWQIIRCESRPSLHDVT